MKKLTSSLLLLVITILTQGQPSEIQIGQPYPVINAPAKIYFSRGNEIIATKFDKEKFIIQKMDASTLTHTSIKAYSDFPNNSMIEGVFKFKDRLLVFYSWWDGTNEYLFSREVDIDAGAFKAPGKPIIAHAGKIAGTLARTGYFSYNMLDKFDFYFTYDESLMVIQYRLKPKVKDDSKNKDAIGVLVYDSDMNEKWKGVMTMPYTEKKMNNISYAVDSNGNLYIVASVYKDDSTDKRKRGDDKPNYDLEILKYGLGSTDPSITKVSLGDKFLHSILLHESPTKDYMICAGLYNNGKRARNVDGVASFKLSLEGKVFDENSHAIPLQILNQYVSAGVANRNQDKEDDGGGAEFENLILRQIKVQNDGSILLSGEQYFIKSHYAYRTTYYTYHYNDILTVKINADGSLAWMNKLPKRQKGLKGKGGMSFRNIDENQKHHYLFLDNQKNITLQTNEIPRLHADGAGGFLTDYTIDDNTGTVTKTYLIDTKDIQGLEAYQFAPSRIIRTPNETITFECYKKGKEDILVRLKLP